MGGRRHQQSGGVRGRQRPHSLSSKRGCRSHSWAKPLSKAPREPQGWEAELGIKGVFIPSLGLEGDGCSQGREGPSTEPGLECAQGAAGAVPAGGILVGNSN